MGYKKRMIGLLKDNARRHRLSEVFSDFCEMAALAFSNRVDHRLHAVREARYLQVAGRYERAEVARFCELLSALTLWMESEEMGDCLGDLFMSLELADSFKGQFFTPYEVSRLMAQLTLGDGACELIAKQGFMRLNEPTCGAAGMVIAVADVLRSQGINFQECLHVVAQDIDRTAVHMAYVQLSLLHIPGVVILGNTLSMEARELWYTPAHVLGGWTHRLRSSEASVPVPRMVEIGGNAGESPMPMSSEQLALFNL